MKKRSPLSNPILIRKLKNTSNMLAVGILTLVSLNTPLSAKTWQTGNGNWNSASSWSGGVPGSGGGSANNADFGYLEQHPDIQVNVNSAAQATLMRIGRGQSVTLNFATNRSLTLGSISRVGDSNVNIRDGEYPAYLTVQGPVSGTGTLSFAQLFIQNGSTLHLRGENLVTNNTSNLILGVGGTQSDNKVLVSDGALLNLNGISVGHPTLAGSATNNSVQIQSNSTAHNQSGFVQIGSNSEHRSNHFSVSGNNALLRLTGGGIRVGDNAGANYGGNSLSVDNGGLISTQVSTTINAFASNGGNNDGHNRLTIGPGGTFESSSTVVNRGLLQLHDGGTLRGAATEDSYTELQITIASSGRFEATGTGLGDTVSTLVEQGGTLAIGTDSQSASLLSLYSDLTFNQDSYLEFDLYEDGSSDMLELSSEATISGPITLILNLSAIGDTNTWTLFSGETTGITATFAVDTESPYAWDLSEFNEDGGWKVSVVPEPSVVLLVMALCLLPVLSFTRKYRANTHTFHAHTNQS